MQIKGMPTKLESVTGVCMLVFNARQVIFETKALADNAKPKKQKTPTLWCPTFPFPFLTSRFTLSVSILVIGAGETSRMSEAFL